MKELTDYVILSSEDPKLLKEQILQKAKSGYTLAGGIQVALPMGARFLQFFQAMYREETITDDSF